MRQYAFLACISVVTAFAQGFEPEEVEIGREISVPRHLPDGQEYVVPPAQLLDHGRRLFAANWTLQEGAGRPLIKGTGNSLSDPASPLLFPRAFNRVSAPDANSCAGCHNAPFGIAGGGGDFVTHVFVLGQRFDFATLDPGDPVPTRGAVDETGRVVNLQGISNPRATLGMFGSGYIEMLARQITADLQAIRDATQPGQTRALSAKGVSFGMVSRRPDGSWDTSRVEGLPASSVASKGPSDRPTLIVRPFHQAGAVVSLRQFTNNAFNHHHGIQAAERFGAGTDPDGDGYVNELTRADVTAVTIFQAALAVPGRVIPNDPRIERAVLEGEGQFQRIGCAGCHIPSLPLDNEGWIFSEPNPYNLAGNLQVGQAPTLRINLNSPALPSPRLKAVGGVVHVPAYTDLKLHDICSGPNDPNAESLDMNQEAGSPGFFAGNRGFLTRKLWGAANEPPYFHHGQFTTLREALLAHSGEALASRRAFEGLSRYEQGSVIEFLKSLQVLPPGTVDLIVDEHGRKKDWPPRP